jgi:hypothetical protein
VDDGEHPLDAGVDPLTAVKLPDEVREELRADLSGRLMSHAESAKDERLQARLIDVEDAMVRAERNPKSPPALLAPMLALLDATEVPSEDETEVPTGGHEP